MNPFANVAVGPITRAGAAAGGAQTMDLTLCDHLTLNGPTSNVTLSITNAKVGQQLSLTFIQDGVGARTLAYNAGGARTWTNNVSSGGGANPGAGAGQTSILVYKVIDIDSSGNVTAIVVARNV